LLFCFFFGIINLFTYYHVLHNPAISFALRHKKAIYTTNSIFALFNIIKKPGAFIIPQLVLICFLFLLYYSFTFPFYFYIILFPYNYYRYIITYFLCCLPSWSIVYSPLCISCDMGTNS
jgi:hypothetical protein